MLFYLHYYRLRASPLATLTQLFASLKINAWRACVVKTYQLSNHTGRNYLLLLDSVNVVEQSRK